MASFDDGKEQGALRTIGEVADALGIKQHVLRYWEQQFPMLQPLKRSGGRRYYRPQDVTLVEAINRLVNHEGYTLKGAKKALSQKGTMTESDPIEHETAADAPHEAEPVAAPAALAGDPGFPFDAELPQDGGLQDFFGGGGPVAPAAAPAVEEAADPAPVSQSADADADRTALVAALKSIRERLASALAA